MGDTPLVAMSWDMTTEHDRLTPYAEDLVRHARSFMVGPYARDASIVDEALRFCSRYDLVPLLHTLDLDLCGLDPLEEDVVAQLGGAARRLGVEWVTTDLAMWAKDGESLVEALVPMPWIADAVDYIVPRVERIQDILGVRVAVENSSYAYVLGEDNPFDIQSEIVRRADSYAAFDVGHYLIATEVTGEDTRTFLPRDFCWDKVVEAHLSGVTVLDAPNGVVADDQHPAPISEQLWDLAGRTLPAAPHLRAVVAESEGMQGRDLVDKVARLAEEVARWGRAGSRR